jgi:two-component system CheB/CheR fusion protein
MAIKKITAKKTTKKGSKSLVSEKKKDDFLVVGIGASAGGLEVFKDFFTAMPDNPGMAFVLIQHLDPTHKSMLVDLLAHHTKMNVEEVKENTLVKPNNLYVIPPNKDMEIIDGYLHLIKPAQERGHRRPIDFFLNSLAADLKERAVGIIVTGTGTEGSLSLKAIKGEGGLSIVQDPETAKYDGMPRNVILAHAADLILPIKEMPAELIKYMRTRKIEPLKKTQVTTSPKDNVLDKIFILLRNATGCNFNKYKSNTVLRRIEKRMAINHVEKTEDYLTHLQKTPTEVLTLFNELLIGVTNFFRDKEAFKQLSSKAIAKIIKQKNNGDTIRIWVTGCSTGEEAYTIAILFNEAISKQKKDISVQIFASDIDERSINKARTGIYPESIAQDVPKNILIRYFKIKNQSYQIIKEIRDQVIFANQNVFKDPPFSKLDLVSCRNLLIYLNHQTQQTIFSIFHYSLNPDGILFLGNSESLGESSDLFSIVDRKQKIYARKNVKVENRFDIGTSLINNTMLEKKNVPNLSEKATKDSLGGITERMLLAKYAPACAIINWKSDAVYFSGNTGKYLQPSPGNANLNIIEMAREGLKSDLRTLIAKARKNKKQEERKGVKFNSSEKIVIVDIIIRPFSQLDPSESYLMIIFEDNNDVKTIASSKTAVIDNTSEIHALEQELDSTKEYLRSTIEELEVSNEELKSSNEELQSSNEELQSTNEELETSKEELQSVNEEMITVNAELQDKMSELANANNDMNNLLSSTDIGTIFLDRELNIKLFTPAVAKIINLIQTDIDRPISHISSNLLYDTLDKDVQSVLDNLIPIKNIVKTNKGIWFQIKIVPYCTTDNKINGVVLTFVDITEEKQVQEKLIESQKNYNDLLFNSHTTIFEQDRKLRYTNIYNPNPYFKINDVIGKTDRELLTNDKEIEALEKLKNKVIKTKKPGRELVSITINKKITNHDLIVRPILSSDKKVTGIICSSTDISDLKIAKKLNNIN